jgi:hypothetical protein
MAQRVDSFEDAGQRRYPWQEWTDGSIWEIKQGEDYDVATENMRVNLHERAKRQGAVVKTKKVGDEGWEGLRFQFMARELVSDGPRIPNRMNQLRYPTGDPRRFQ